jgi:hypothetical protein
VFRVRGRGGPAALAALVCLAVAPASAGAEAFTPPPKKSYFGVSDTGVVDGFKKFRADVKSHPAVLQTFHTWGTHPWRAMNRWARTNTRGMLSIGTSECYDCPGVINPKQIAQGRGDEYPLTLARRFAAEDETVYIRLFAEMNGHWNAYSAYNQDGSSRGPGSSTTWFRRAWRRFALIVRGGPRAQINRKLRRMELPPLLRAERARRYRRQDVGRQLPRANVALMWVPQSQGSPNLAGNQPDDYWPGGRWVDWVGVDIYAKYPNFAGMERIYRAYRGKPFVVGEWSPWDYDSPGFVHQLFGFAQRHPRVRLTVYYQGFEANDPHRIWHYPAAQTALRRELNANGIKQYAPGSKRPKPEDPGDEAPQPPPDGGVVPP